MTKEQKQFARAVEEMRIPSRKNPSALKLGDVVSFTHESRFFYLNDLRIHQRRKLSAPQIGYVVGLTSKAIGKYQKPYRSLNPEDYEQASLKVSMYVRVYVVKTELNGPEIFVIPTDLELWDTDQ